MEERRILLSEKQTGFKPLGFIESSFRTKFGTPRQPGLAPSSKAKLKLRRDLQPELSLQGLEGFSHAWLIFEFHENTNKIFRPKIHPPRLGGKTVGVFATRSPHRPNPIGLSLVKVDRVDRDGIEMSGIDLIHGTPVIDIKPYVPGIESPQGASAGWLVEVAEKNWDVEFSSECQMFFESLPSQEAEHLQNLIKESLALDPRPVLYRDMFDPETAQEHAVYLEDFDVHFQYEAERILVLKILRSAGP
jgi:tRNA-Thr(GGU) m(6)t(6)A37 methyltransferase TsaA